MMTFVNKAFTRFEGVGRRLGWLLAGLLVLAPSIAEACPACAARENGGIAVVLFIGAMMALPFGVAGVVVLAIRKVHADEAVLEDRGRSGDLQT